MIFVHVSYSPLRLFLRRTRLFAPLGARIELVERLARRPENLKQHKIRLWNYAILQNFLTTVALPDMG